MRSNVPAMYRKMLDFMTDNEGYHSAKQLAARCHMSRSSVYANIRRMRLNHIGVLPNPKGYILSKFAKKGDDVYFIRRVNGRMVGDRIAVAAALPDILPRWQHDEDFKRIMAPWTANHIDDLLHRSATLLLTKNGAHK